MAQEVNPAPRGGVKIRAFLALPLAELFQSEMAPLLTQLKKQYHGVRWVRPENIHVTLHFFGSIEPAQVKTISHCLRPLSLKTKPVEVRLQDLGAFPHFKRPRVIWVGIRGEVDPLRRLHRSMEDALKKAGFKCEDREFKLHLTLGRVKERGGGPPFQPIPFSPTPSKRIEKAVLFQSHLTPEGPRYEAIETYPFASA